MDNTRYSSFCMIASRILHFNFDSSILVFEEYSLNKQFGVTNSVKLLESKDGDRFGSVELDIKVKLEGTDSSSGLKADIHLIIEGGFSAPEAMSDDDFKSMLEINGSAALYSIARAYIISVTSQSFARGSVILPMVNFFPLENQSESQKNS